MEDTIFKNPIIAEQSKAEIPFVEDKYLGHTMPKGRDFIGESDYISLDSVIQQIKASGKRVILNIGDSSTSGWDSNIVTENRERLTRGESLKPAFFRYKTYSDYLREQVGDDFIVINAGVPAHTSLQGKRRLEQLVNRFTLEKIHVDYVTAYYGNNDSVWEENREDDILKSIAEGKERIAVVEFGGSHAWGGKESCGEYYSLEGRISYKDNLAKWNKEHPYQKFCLIEVLPRWYEN